MKWSDIFRDPDMVGASEYRAIVDCCATGALGEEEWQVDPERELDEAQVNLIQAMLVEFKDWATYTLNNFEMNSRAGGNE